VWLAQIYDSGRDFQIEFGAVYGKSTSIPPKRTFKIKINFNGQR
jgi:hypothetical protein